MADNFLEKHFQEYQARKASMGSTVRSTKKRSETGKLQKNVLIANGNTPIGKALVKAFCDTDCKVAFGGSNKEEGLLLAKQTGAAFFHLEGSSDKSLEHTMDTLTTRWGVLDVLVLNTAQSASACLASNDTDDSGKVLLLQVDTYLSLSRKWIEYHKEGALENNYGRILMVCPPTSGQNQELDVYNQLTLNAIHTLTQYLSQNELLPGMTVNTVTPLWKEEEDIQETGKADELAHLCVFLAHPQNRGISGENFKIQSF